MRTNARKASAAVVGVIAGDDKQGPRLQLFCREVRRCAEKYDAINLTRRGLDRRIAGGSAAKILVMFGGYSSGPARGDTWLLAFEP